ncbi:MAG TPA: glycoside hydrolase family 3 N-terminal domain-containing protein, partial [Amaricoccus sp.]|nr:glycoside hydrolase family 3 N-terminal domain-containing protein [Amaricoccus sp.]
FLAGPPARQAPPAMNRRRVLTILAASPALAALGPGPAREQADDLLGRMTLAEKIGQLTMVTAGYTVTGPTGVEDIPALVRAGRVGSLFNLWGRPGVRAHQRLAVEESRLGIPLFFGLDVLHGFRTVFPIPLAEAGAFDPALWEKTARIAAAEAASAGLDLTFAPMLDVSRDPRWGRIAEGPGEDPHVGASFAAAKVRGFQGHDLSGDLSGLAATPKHLAAYGASTAGRDYAPVDVSDRALAEVYLPPFRAAVEAGAAALMPGFTDIAGIPLTANRGLLTGTLREAWGFDGVVISDYGAIGELIRHGVAADLAEAAALALNAGVDIDMMSFAYEKGLPLALDRGLVGLAAIDAAVGRVLRLKARLGLLADPYRRATGDDPPARLDRPAARAAALASIALLQNDGALPFPPAPGRIALLGPLADAPAEMLGPWVGTGRGDEAVGVLAGLKAALPGAAIEHAPGVAIAGDDTGGIPSAVAAARRADRVVLCLGEAAGMSGEAASRARIDLPGRQAELAAAVLATGRPVVVLLFSGRPIAMPDVFARATAVLACWFPGSEAGHAVAALLTGAASPSAGLAVTWPRDVGQVPIAYSARPGGRPENPQDHYTSKYLDLPNAPQFPFGHGLAYTRFAVGEPAVTVSATIEVEATIANTAERPGSATLFLFLRDPVASVARPTLELRRFARVTDLAPGESRRVRFTLERADLAFLDAALRPVVEPGRFELHLGLSADPANLRTVAFNLD